MVYCKGQPLATQVFQLQEFLATLDLHADNGVHLWQVGRSIIHLQSWPADTSFAAARTVAPNAALSGANLSDTMYFRKDRWIHLTNRTMESWRRRWRLPSRIKSVLQAWVQEQWRRHEESCQDQRNGHWTPREVQQALGPFRHLIRGPADHFPNSLFVSCPVHYHELLIRTFGDKQVFRPCCNGTVSILRCLRQDFEQRHPDLRLYKWSFQWEAGLPVARILPKESKSFMKARPIIAYTKCWHTKTSSFLATALFELMQVAFPAQSTWNTASVHKALDSAWRHIQAVEAHCEALEMVQQDLIGFFNSVPHDRISQALDLLIWRLEELFHRSVNDIVFQVDMAASTKGLRIFRGQQRFRRSVTKKLRLCHVQELTQFLLQSAYFKVGRDTFRQVQGASMGSPLAPVLCSLVAAEQEFLLIHSFRQQLQAAGLLRAFRYADNRCFFLRSSELHTDWAELILQLAFYGLPIELEHVPGEQLLGSTTSTIQGTITMQQPSDITVLRSMRSVGPASAAISGFRARALTIVRQTRPGRLIRPQVEA